MEVGQCCVSPWVLQMYSRLTLYRFLLFLSPTVWGGFFLNMYVYILVQYY